MHIGNIYRDLPPAHDAEQFQSLAQTANARIERIVSQGQATPPGEWYDQEQDEWIMLVSGAAALLLEGDEQPVLLAPGDHLLIPAHRRHRVTWTATDKTTIWLAVHLYLS